MKKLFLSFILFLLIGGTAMAGCPVSGSDITGTLANGSLFVTISSIGTIEIPFNTLPPGNNQSKAAEVERILQTYFDNRQLLTSIPTDDPDRFPVTRPDFPYLFWGDVDGNPAPPDVTDITGWYLISRNCVVTITVVGSGANTTVEVTFSSP